jgi:hypothetical protein
LNLRGKIQTDFLSVALTTRPRLQAVGSVSSGRFLKKNDFYLLKHTLLSIGKLGLAQLN